MLLDLTESYSVYAGLLPAGGVWLEPGQEAWATVLVRGRLRKTIDLYIPDNLWRQGVTELHDILKLIVSTDEADATLLQQGDCRSPSPRPCREGARRPLHEPCWHTWTPRVVRPPNSG